MILVEMPKANENMTEATLDQWLVQEGARVARDQPLCAIITDKAKFELPSPGEGCVLRIFARDHALLPIGYVLCALGQAGEEVPADVPHKNDALVAAFKAAATALPASGVSSGPIDTSNVVRATPAARRLAKERGIDLGSVSKALKLSGPVTEKDIQKYLESTPPSR